MGSPIEISGDRILLGAPYGNDSGRQGGSVYVFKHDGMTWLEEAELFLKESLVDDQFGGSVFINSDVIFAGAPADDILGEDAGAAYVFRKQSEWIEEARITSAGGMRGDHFGASIAGDSSHAVVGAPGDDDAEADAGSISVFNFDGSTWIEETEMTVSDPAVEAALGTSVAYRESLIAAGAPGDDDSGACTGAVYIFSSDTKGWEESFKLTASDARVNSLFGASVSLSNSWLLVGAYADDQEGPNAGAAYLFRDDGAGWIEETKLTAPVPMANDRFGYSVDVEGDCAVVGIPLDDETGNDAGAVYVFSWDGSSWGVDHKLMAADGNPGDYFGTAVSISGDNLLVSAIGNDEGGWNAPAAYHFKRIGATWVEQAKLHCGFAGSLTDITASLSLGFDIAVIGAPYDDQLAKNAGAAYVFDVENSIKGSLVCVPSSGTLPFTTNISAILTNSYSQYQRRVAAQLNVTLPTGSMYGNWRAGWTNLSPAESFSSVWDQLIPELGTLVGDIRFDLRYCDVTPPPYNQPPYPESGDTDTAACTLTGFAP